jgi:predicted DNA-binding transcriptional regulator YafY
MRALTEAGVPILTEEGKGYTLMDGYKIPPIMFTEKQANALILAEQLVLKNKDSSFVRDYIEAIEKIKAVLSHSIKEKANLLAARTRFEQNINSEKNSNNLSELQFALTNYFIADMEYINESGEHSSREVEPFALVSTNANWLLIAMCKLRGSFRYFRLDRIIKVTISAQKFTPHEMTLQCFFDQQQPMSKE